MNISPTSFADPVCFAESVHTRRAEERRFELSRSAIGQDVDRLRTLLEDAELAHAKFEAACGPDADWPKWYAEYLLGVR